MPVPDTQIYELKLLFWIVTTLLGTLSGFLIWFLVRMINHQDEINKQHSEGLKAIQEDYQSIAILTSEKVRELKSEIEETEFVVLRIKTESEKSLNLLFQITRELYQIKETLTRHENVIYDIKENLSKH